MKNEAEEILESLMSALGVRNYTALAEKLGVAQNTVSVWKNKNNVDSIIKAATSQGINIQNITRTDATNIDFSHGKTFGSAQDFTSKNQLFAEFEKLVKVAEGFDQVEYLEECIKKCKKEIVERAKL